MLSIVIACKNEGENVENTVKSITLTEVKQPYEIVVVDDGSKDDCCKFLRDGKWPKVKLITTEGIGTGKARNLGAMHALGDVLAFCDAHIFVEDYWLDNLLEVLQKENVGAVSPGIVHTKELEFAGYGLGWSNPLDVNWLTTNGSISPVPVLPAGCLVVKKNVFNEIGGFDEELKNFFHDDMELTTKMWLFGYEALVVPKVHISHIFKFRPPGLDYNPLYYNVLKLAFYHFKPERIKRLISYIKNQKNFAEDYSDIILDKKVWEKRERYLNLRKHDDDWFINKFRIPF